MNNTAGLGSRVLFMHGKRNSIDVLFWAYEFCAIDCAEQTSRNITQDENERKKINTPYTAGKYVLNLT